MKKIAALLLLVVAAATSFAQEMPYNENQDVRGEIKKAISAAQLENKNVLMQFGGNWCPWCLRFHRLANTVPAIDSVLKENFVYILVNVPKEKEKRDYLLFEDYQFPNRFGYPVFVILDKTGRQIHIQDSEAFEHPDPKVKGYDTTKVKKFLTMWTPKAIDPATYRKK